MDTSEYVTLLEAARLLGISRTKMWQLAQSLAIYELPTDGRVKLLKRSDVEALRQPRPRLASDPKAAAALPVVVAAA